MKHENTVEKQNIGDFEKEEVEKALRQMILKDAVQVFSKESLLERLKSGKPLCVKLGADPSRPDLHLGHTVVLRKLRLFQQLGAEIVFVIGDFTAMIGDPTGRSKTRPALTIEQTRKSGETYLSQVTKILDPDKTKIRYNSEWLDRLNFSDIIKLSSQYTLARMLERDDFKNRYENKLPLCLHELLYPLAQGYDSVALHADVEVGGTDQTFNLLVGRALQSSYGQTPQEVITYPLLVGLDGKNKMSKSLDNTIALDEPAAVMFEKSMRIPDTLLFDYFRLTTDFGEAEALRAVQTDIRDAHFLYAREITRLYGGKEAAAEAEQRYRQISAGSLPDAMPSLQISIGETESGRIKITALLRKAGFASSNAEARRNIAGGGVKINGSPVTNTDAEIELSQPFILQFGKNRFCKISSAAQNNNP